MLVVLLIYAAHVSICEPNQLHNKTNIDDKNLQLPEYMTRIKYTPESKYMLQTYFSANTSECRDTKLGETYTGTVQHTALGYQCQPWVTINLGKIQNEDFPDECKKAAVNYCRNPDKDSNGIWCAVFINAQPYKRYCNAPYCGNVTVDRSNCKISKQGSEYAGEISRTTRGYQCRSWHKITKYRWGRFNYEFPENDIHAAKNYCRNPSKDMLGPWCYVSQKLNIIQDYCSIPFCHGYCNYDKSPFCTNATINPRNCKTTRSGANYAGDISYTKQGYLCQAWHKQTPK